jgi:phage tail sheath protein FI
VPAALTYPGVYVEEVRSGVRTITGVATSITAFVGRAPRGPVDTPVTLNSFGDFESEFGGLANGYALGFAVRDFFVNGGSRAIVVRLYRAEVGDDAPAASRTLAVGDFELVAASPGRWGAHLRVAIDVDNVSADAAASLGVGAADLFHLTVRDVATGRAERYLNLTAVESPRRIDRVLEAESRLLRHDGDVDPASEVAAGKDELSDLEDAYASARKALTDAQNSGAADVPAKAAASAAAKAALDTALGEAAESVSDGAPLTVLDFLPAGAETDKRGLYALEKVDLFNLLVIPPYRAATDAIDVDPNLVAEAATYCERRRAMLLLDSPKGWTTKTDARDGMLATDDDPVGTRSRNAALFFPRLRKPNPLRENQVETFAAAGAIAGVYARTDAQRGVWKAPAGLDATLDGVPQLAAPLTDAENGELNPLGLNCLRSFPGAGRVVWGARTLRGADSLADEYKYVPVRRTALYLEESLFRGLKWVVFEPNDEPLWAQIRLNVGAFLHNLFRQGAFQGTTPRDAYFVKCDKETTTQNDVDRGIVNVVVGFAPLKPAEFVVLKLQQIAGQIEV